MTTKPIKMNMTPDRIESKFDVEQSANTDIRNWVKVFNKGLTLDLTPILTKPELIYCDGCDFDISDEGVYVSSSVHENDEWEPCVGPWNESWTRCLGPCCN